MERVIDAFQLMYVRDIVGESWCHSQLINLFQLSNCIASETFALSLWTLVLLLIAVIDAYCSANPNRSVSLDLGASFDCWDWRVLLRQSKQRGVGCSCWDCSAKYYIGASLLCGGVAWISHNEKKTNASFCQSSILNNGKDEPTPERRRCSLVLEQLLEHCVAYLLRNSFEDEEVLADEEVPTFRQQE